MKIVALFMLVNQLSNVTNTIHLAFGLDYDLDVVYECGLR